MLIAIAGPKGSGKDTAAQPLLDVGFRRINFSDELKWLACEIFNFTRGQCESQEAKERPFDQPLAIDDEHIIRLVTHEYRHPDLDASITRMIAAYAGLELPSLRALLQWIGTAFRNQVSKDFWIDAWRNKVNRHRATGARVVCTDVRYANERQAVRDIGGVLFYVDRPGLAANDQHASENDFGDETEYDFVFTNDQGIEQLQDRVAARAICGNRHLLTAISPLDALHLYFTGRPKEGA